MTVSFLFILSLIFITDLMDTIGQLALKASINAVGMDVNSIQKALRLIIRLMRFPRVWFGFLLSGMSLLVWLFVLSKAELGFAFSLDSMRYILIAIASAIFLKEKITAGRWMGIFCVVAGIFLVALGKH